MVVDTTVGAATQLIFVMSGVALLLMRSTERNVLVVAWAVLIGTGVFFAAIAAFVIFQHRGLFVGSAKLALDALLPEAMAVRVRRRRIGDRRCGRGSIPSRAGQLRASVFV